MRLRLVTVLMAAVLALMYAEPAVAAARPTAGPSVTAPSATLAGGDRAMYEQFKAYLTSSPDFSRQMQVAGNTRIWTFTYQGPVSHSVGDKFVLQEPVGSAGAAISPQLSVGGCGFLQVCVWLNQTDQIYLEQFGVGFIAAVICSLAPPMCPFAAGAAAAAWQYLSNHSLCPNYLVITLFPWPGTVVGCY